MPAKLDSLSGKYSGYYATFRGRFWLLSEKILKLQEFVLYEAGLVLAVWDADKKAYGLLNIPQQDIETFLGVSAGFVSRWKVRLFEKGFWQELENGRIKINLLGTIKTGASKRIGSYFKSNYPDNLQSYFGCLQKAIAETQDEIAEEQTKTPKEECQFQPEIFANSQEQLPKSDLVSSKDEFKFSFISREDYVSSSESWKKYRNLAEGYSDNDPTRAEKYQKMCREIEQKLFSYELKNFGYILKDHADNEEFKKMIEKGKL